MSADTPRRLGRGLEALISTAKQQRESSSAQHATDSVEAGFQMLAIAEIRPNQFQPRRFFSEAELGELQASIKASGLLQPITVRRSAERGWELVTGERRLRAATRMGWTQIPAIVREFDDRAMLTLALVENLQRADLNALEEAEGYARLISEFRLTQQQVADAIGKDRTTITNLLRLLTLPAAVRAMVEDGRLTPGHARALLAVKDPRAQGMLANEIVARQLSVRDVEARAREIAEGKETIIPNKAARAPHPLPSAIQNPEVRRVEERLRKHLQTDVSVQLTEGQRGVVRIAFYSEDDLDRLLHLIVPPARSDFD